MEGLLKFRVWVDDQNPSTVQMDLSVEHRAVFANGATVAVLSLDAAQPQDKGSVQPTADNSAYAKCAEEIMRSISGRSGIDLYQYGSDITKEITQSVVDIISAHFA